MCPQEPEVHRTNIIKDPTTIRGVLPQEDSADRGGDGAHLGVLGRGQAGPHGAWIEFI